MDLYTTHAKEFSKTRQSPWKGWEKVVKELRVEELSVLDLGCGNGRFLRYLVNNEELRIKNYLGIDNSTILLNIAKKEFDFSAFEFANKDLNQMDWSKDITGEFNLIVSFGVMHHIETFELRRNILEASAKFLEKEGILAIAYWQFLDDPKLKAKAEKLEGENNYMLPFGQNGAKRFCHFVDEDEAKKLEEDLSLQRIDSFYDDGKNGKMNSYVVYRKVD